MPANRFTYFDAATEELGVVEIRRRREVQSPQGVASGWLHQSSMGERIIDFVGQQQTADQQPHRGFKWDV